MNIMHSRHSQSTHNHQQPHMCVSVSVCLCICFSSFLYVCLSVTLSVCGLLVNERLCLYMWSVCVFVTWLSFCVWVYFLCVFIIRYFCWPLIYCLSVSSTRVSVSRIFVTVKLIAFIIGERRVFSLKGHLQFQLVRKFKDHVSSLRHSRPFCISGRRKWCIFSIVNS